MKLYLTATNSKGKNEGIGDDKWIEIELTCGNNLIGRIILDYQGGNDWELSYQQGNNPSYKIDSCITPKSCGCEENVFVCHKHSKTRQKQ